MTTPEDMIRIIYSMRDFQLSYDALSFLSPDYPEKADLSELRHLRCFETAMVVAYGRPFSMSPGALPQFDFAMVDMSLSDAETALHTELRNLRNKRVAHSDFDTMRMKATSIDICGFPMPYLQFDESLHFTKDQLNELSRYLHRLITSIGYWVQETGEAEPTLLEHSINTGANEGWPPQS